MLFSAFLGPGCSENVIVGEAEMNVVPTVEISNGPVENQETRYSVHFFWKGYDPDGEIERFEVCLVDGFPLGFDPDDTTGADKWTRTMATDTIVMVEADRFDTTLTINHRKYSKYDRTHVFFVRAVDDRGGVSQAVHRSFTAWTLAPQVLITSPRVSHAGEDFQNVCPLILFEWDARDPIDYPWNYKRPAATRYLWTPYHLDILEELNSDPDAFMGWSEWMPSETAEDSAFWTLIGDDEVVPEGKFVFAVQAKDEAGAVTSIFDPTQNVRHCRVMQPTGPLLRVSDPYLGAYSFIGLDMDVVSRMIPPGYPVEFSWTATAEHYGAVVSTFRYGWDIDDLSDPMQWSCYPSPYVRSIPPRKFYSGVHTLYVEAADHLGTLTIAVIELEVISAIMDKDLLWVDDFRSTDFIQENWSFPTESQHDKFWEDVCLRARGFNPKRDIYDVAQNGSFRPPMDLLWKYKNVLWTYSGAASEEDMSAWNKIIEFKPEEIYGEDANLNMIHFYIAFGGHLWSQGQSLRTGALAAVLPPGSEIFPSVVSYDAVPGNTPSDLRYLGKECYTYYDCCVSVLDKVDATFQQYLPVPRTIELDAMRYAFRDDTDPYLDGTPGFPDRLVLWDQVTAPGRFFDPSLRGFLYVEIYDPEYWMRRKGLTSQSCMRPIYRMKARESRSCLNDQTIAFWTTRFEDVQPPCGDCVAAPSVHFGIPLWFFNRAQVDSIADAIFERWQIKQE